MIHTRLTLTAAALGGLMFAASTAGATPLASSLRAANAGSPDHVVRVHGTNAPPVHCHMAWSTSRGWHAHWRECDLPRFNPRWRDPAHWHWYEPSRWRWLDRLRAPRRYHGREDERSYKY